MTTPNIAGFLADSKPPRLAAISPNNAKALVEAAKKIGYAIWALDGRKMKNDETIFDHFAQVLHFPDYFGRNWDAMDECLRDMEWAPAAAHLLVVNDADALFLTSPASFKSLIDCMRFASNHWHEKVPFKVVFTTNSSEIASITDARLDHP
jgi:RNAse (barnase) inhibitor barstar